VFVIVRAGSGGEPARLEAVSPAGRLAWSRQLPGDCADMPVTAGDVVVIGYGIDLPDGTGGLRAYTVKGDQVWDARMVGAPDVAPAVAGGVVYVGNYDNRLYAVRASDGAELWQVALDSDVARPAVLGGTLAVSTNGGDANWLYGIDTRGKRLWKKAGRGGGYGSTPVPVGSLFVDAVGERLVATGADGTPAWEYTPAADLGRPAASGGVCYVRSGTEIHAVDLKGRLRWKAEAGGAAETTLAPLVAGKRLYVPSAGAVAAMDVTA
jgi:outer membrane protein assembly factor BamB